MFLENTVNSSEQFGSIEVICGSMFSGKTEELIHRIKRAHIANQKVIVFKPFVDSRYDDSMIVSHDENQLKATVIRSSEEIIKCTEGFDVIAIDEAQFFDKGIVTICNKLANQGFRIIIAGLDMDYKGNPFGPMPNLMAIAEYVTKVHAVCSRSGGEAQYTFRKNEDDDLIVIGEKKKYEALSRYAFHNAMKKRINKKKQGLTTLNIYLDRLSHNLNFLRSKISPKSELIAVVKANAYGHGAIEIAKYLEDLGVSKLAVASAYEGKILRENGIKCKIIVFYPHPYDISEIIKFSLEPAIFSKRMWIDLTSELKKLKLNYFPVHLKFNTGLNRIGFEPKEIGWIKEKIANSSLKIESVYSHLSSSEEKRKNNFTDSQIKTFEKIKNLFLNIDTSIKFHLLNSSGIFNYPECNYDWVRTGISLYGYSNNIEWDKNLLPIAELTTKIIQIHKLKKNQVVGYNNGWIAKQKTTVATIPIGHADGVGRYFGNSNVPVWIKNKRAEIIGNICMDMFMVDITNINCSEGDEVVIFNKNNPANTFAELGGSISYELLSSIGNRIIRNYLQ